LHPGLAGTFADVGIKGPLANYRGTPITAGKQAAAAYSTFSVSLKNRTTSALKV
jgi:hypothetical protein